MTRTLGGQLGRSERVDSDWCNDILYIDNDLFVEVAVGDKGQTVGVCE